MAITFVGYYRPAAGTPTAADADQARRTGQNFSDEFLEKIRELPSILPETCSLIGSWNPTGGEVPGVMVVEAEGYADLAAINGHYVGYLAFDWHPTATGGVSRTGPID
ncbi:MAG: hypothetical protein QF681_16890 [Vicinamibacterales bacterium]|jgi:hypothetical protein|nr:hypothetical protein [Vicinamibacterales bacterium]